MTDEEKAFKEAIEAINYCISILKWHRENLKNKKGDVSTMGDPPPVPPPIPCPVGWYEEGGKCYRDIGQNANNFNYLLHMPLLRLGAFLPFGTGK